MFLFLQLIEPSVQYFSGSPGRAPSQAETGNLCQQSSTNWKMTNVCWWTSDDGCDPGSLPSSRMTNLFSLTQIIKCMSQFFLTQPLFFPHATADLWTFLALSCPRITYFLCSGSTKLSQLNIWSLWKVTRGSVLHNISRYSLPMMEIVLPHIGDTAWADQNISIWCEDSQWVHAKCFWQISSCFEEHSLNTFL